MPERRLRPDEYIEPHYLEHYKTHKCRKNGQSRDRWQAHPRCRLHVRRRCHAHRSHTHTPIARDQCPPDAVQLEQYPTTTCGDQRYSRLRHGHPRTVEGRGLPSRVSAVRWRQKGLPQQTSTSRRPTGVWREVRDCGYVRYTLLPSSECIHATVY